MKGRGERILKNRSYILEVIIGALVLIIISLCLKILTPGVDLFPSWFAQTLFGGLFTLSGAFLGATIAGNHAVKVMTNQHELLKQEKINELNFEFRKRYANVQGSIASIIKRMDIIIEGKSDLSDSDSEIIIRLIHIANEQLQAIPPELISEEKYESFIVCLETLNEFEMTLEWNVEILGIEIDKGEIEYYREVLIASNKLLKE